MITSCVAILAILLKLCSLGHSHCNIDIIFNIETSFILSNMYNVVYNGQLVTAIVFFLSNVLSFFYQNLLLAVKSFQVCCIEMPIFFNLFVALLYLYLYVPRVLVLHSTLIRNFTAIIKFYICTCNDWLWYDLVKRSDNSLKVQYVLSPLQPECPGICIWLCCYLVPLPYLDPRSGASLTAPQQCTEAECIMCIMHQRPNYRTCHAC